MWFRNMNLKGKILCVVSIPLMILIVFGVFTNARIKSMLESNERVEHTYQVLEGAKEITGSAVDMETGMRGYLLAGKEIFLEPYNQGREYAFEKIELLKKTVSDNPKQVDRLDKIEKNLKEWLENVGKTNIAMRREIGDAETMNDIAHIVGQARGKKYFDRFRSQIATFISRESELILKWKKDFETASNSINDHLKEIDENDKQAEDTHKAIEELIAEIAIDLKTMEESRQWVDHTYKVIQKAMKILTTAVDMETGMRGFLLAGKEEFLGPYLEGGKNFSRLVSEMKETVSDNPSQVELLGQIEETMRGWKENVTEPAIRLRKKIGEAKTMDDMADLIGEARGKNYFDEFRKLISDFQAEENRLMKERREKNEKIAKMTIFFIRFGMLAGIILCIVMTIFIANLIAGPLKKGVDFVQSVARGDLTSRIDVNQKDEVGVLSGAMKNMITMLREVVENIKASSDNVAQGSKELTDSSESLSQGANEQAASLEEISSTMVEIDAQARSNGKNASDLNTNMSELKDMADTGMDEMENMKSAMKEIEQASKSIAKIIDVIDDIASQTNLLALNATIEAASAGEAGRGFAVVANEIKELANQSAGAAKETAELIENSIKKVENGSKITNRTAEALKHIAVSAIKGAEMTADISEAANEQTHAIVQITQAIEQVDQVTQNNTANAEQAAAAAQELNSQSEQLKQILTKFKLNHDDRDYA
ncbi:CHASE3 domain-containing protein [Desulfobacterales bacterium HSG17]|nr:CHASE3 domain-containing protein [Desulfobacterales bacterium HSG17]